MTEPVTTGQIYWGAVPFVVIQCIMVGLVIAFPGMVMHYKSSAPEIDPSKVKIELPAPAFPGIPGMPGIPGEFNLPPPSFGGPTGQAPVPVPPPSLPAAASTPPAASPSQDAPSSSVPSPPPVDIGVPRELQPPPEPKPN